MKRAIALLFCCCSLTFAAGLPRAERMTGDKDTLLLLENDAGHCRDVSGRIADGDIILDNVVCAPDGVLLFGDKPGSITVKDNGKINYPDGLTVEAWVKLDKKPTEAVVMGGKYAKQWHEGSFELLITPQCALTLTFMGLKGEKYDSPTEIPGRKRVQTRNFYPGRINNMNGRTLFPVGEWVHLAYTYERKSGILRTWINRGIDREAENPWSEIASELTDADAMPLQLFRKAKNMQVAQIRVSNVARQLGPVAPMMILVTENPYRDESYITLTRISDAVPVPSELYLCNGDPGNVVRYPLLNRKTQNFVIPKYKWSNAESELVVKLYHDRREIFNSSVILLNPATLNPDIIAFSRGEPYRGGKKHPEWWINKDNSISRNGKKIFPLCIYFVPPEDLELVTSLGFNQISLMNTAKGMKREQWSKISRETMEKAARLGVSVSVEADDFRQPGQGFLSAFDEPWGYSLEPIRRKYMYLRNGRQRSAELIVTGVQNNQYRYRETALGADLFGVDPYTIHVTMPLRYIHDSTVLAVRAVDGKKPVITVLENYGSLNWRPTAAEFRTGAYMAIIGGANALAFYAWNEGAIAPKSPSTRDLPEIVEMYRSLLKELNSLAEVLVEPNMMPGPVVEPSSPRGVFACGKKSGAQLYLFVASDLHYASKRTLVWPAGGDLRGKCIYGGAGELRFSGGRAELTLPPLGAAFFELE